ncbi:hypothetical protein ACT7CZ_13845, partial [Bacillus cereus]
YIYLKRTFLRRFFNEKENMAHMPCIIYYYDFSSCNATNANSKGKIKLGVTSWKENIATANMWKVLLEQKRLQS